MTLTTETPEIDVLAWRKAARRRAWICPGAGFAALGQNFLGVLAFLSGIGTFVSAIVCALWPSHVAFWTTLCIFLISGFLWIWELVATYTAWPARDAAMPSGNRHWHGAALTWLCIGGFAAAVVTSYRVVDVQDEGMSPTIEPGERIIYQRRVDGDRLQKGQLIIFRLSPESRIGTPGELKVGRILVMPGESLSQFNRIYYIAGQPGPATPAIDDRSQIALKVKGRDDNPETVPPDCYFVTQDSPTKKIDGQLFHYVRRADIESTRLYQIDRRPFLGRIE